MVEEVSEQEQTNTASQEVENVEQEQTPVEEKLTTEVSSGEEETKETSIYDDKVFRQEAEKIRESTKHKISKRYEKDLASERQKISELEERVKTLSTPPDEESFYDETLGQWCASNMTAKEYGSLLQEHTQKRKGEEAFRQKLAPLEERTAKIAESIDDFQPIMTMAVQNRAVSQELVLAAAQEDGGLEILYDLVKTNSPKLVELSRMPSHEQTKALWKMTWAKNSTPPDVKTSADEPIKPESESATVDTDYSSMNFRDGHKEFNKRRGRRRG